MLLPEEIIYLHHYIKKIEGSENKMVDKIAFLKDEIYYANRALITNKEELEKYELLDIESMISYQKYVINALEIHIQEMTDKLAELESGK